MSFASHTMGSAFVAHPAGLDLTMYDVDSTFFAQLPAKAAHPIGSGAVGYDAVPMLMRSRLGSNLSSGTCSSGISDPESEFVRTPLVEQYAWLPHLDVGYEGGKACLIQGQASLNPTSPEFVPRMTTLELDPTDTEDASHAVLFGPELTPEFVPAEDASSYLGFLDSLVSCDSFTRSTRSRGHKRRSKRAVPGLNPRAPEFVPQQQADCLVDIISHKVEEIDFATLATEHYADQRRGFAQSPLMLNYCYTAQDWTSASPIHEFEYSPFPSTYEFEYADPRILQEGWVAESEVSAQDASLTSESNFFSSHWLPALVCLLLMIVLVSSMLVA